MCKLQQKKIEIRWIWRINTQQSDRYNSKDCLMISIFPSTATNSLTEQAVKLLISIFKVNIGCESIETCHYSVIPNAELASMIINFIYFKDKNFIWMAKVMLRGVDNKSYEKYVFCHWETTGIRWRSAQLCQQGKTSQDGNRQLRRQARYPEQFWQRNP